MGPGDIKQKIDEREAKSNLPSARLAGRRLGDGRQSGRHELVLSGPRARCFLPNSGSWRAGEEPRLEPHPPQPADSPAFGRNFGSFTHAPAPGGAGTEHPGLTHSEVPGPAWGFQRAPRPCSAPQLGGGGSSAQSSPPPLPGARAWIRPEDTGCPAPTRSKCEKRASDHAGRTWGGCPAALRWARAPAILLPRRGSPGARSAPPGTDPAAPRP